MCNSVMISSIDVDVWKCCVVQVLWREIIDNNQKGYGMMGEKHHPS